MVPMRRLLSLLLIPIICYAAENESDVLTLTTGNFDEVLPKHSFLVVKFYAPWCVHCKNMAQAWEKAATLLKNDESGVKITLAEVNVVEEKEMGSRFKILSFPTLKMFIGGSKEGEDYEGPRDDPEGIVEFLKSRADPSFKPPPKSVDAADAVLVLTDSNFDQAIAEHPMVLVDFYAPWCGHCKTLEPDFKEAAAMIRDAGVLAVALAKVDATVEKGLAAKYEVKGFPTLKIFEGGAKPMPYDGPRDAHGIVEHLRGLAGPPSTELTDVGEAARLKAGSPVLVVYAAENLAHLDSWLDVARSLRRQATFVHSTEPAVWDALQVEEGVTILKAFDEPVVRFDGGPADAARLRELINYHRFEVAMPIRRGDKAALRVFFEDDARPNLFLFLSNADLPEGQAAVAAFRESARAVRGAMVSGYFSMAGFPEVFEVFGLKDAAKRNELPEVLIELRKTSARYRMGKREVTAADVAEFIAAYQAGALAPYVKSQAEPADNSGAVRVVVGSTFERDASRAGRWVLLKAYAPWCGHCKTLAPVYEAVGAAYAGVEGVSIAEVDATENDLPASLGLKSYPTLYLFRGDGSSPEVYSGERSVRAIVAFVANTTGVDPSPSYVPPPPPPPPPARPTRPAEVPIDAPPPKDTPLVDEAAGPVEWVRQALAQEVQVPWMAAGYTVPGGFLAVPAALLVVLLLLAVVSALSPVDAPRPAAAVAAAKAGKAAAAKAGKKD